MVNDGYQVQIGATGAAETRRTFRALATASHKLASTQRGRKTVMIRGASGELRFWTIDGRALYPDGEGVTAAAVLALRDTLVERSDPSPSDRRRAARAGLYGRRGARRMPPVSRVSKGYVSAVTVRMADGQTSFIVEVMPVNSLVFGAS